jgi:hypothetical protein
MWSVGTVFIIKSLPYFWSAAKDLQHLHLISSISHLAKGFLMMAIIGGSSTFFYKSAKDLASRSAWIEMENYVTNYPAEVKQEILASRTKTIGFYICALIPETTLAMTLSRNDFYFSQFRSEKNKVFFLERYFTNANKKHWPLAVHLFQQLPVKSQILLGPQLSAISQNFSEAERDAFPDDVKAVILNQTLKSFLRIPYEHESDYPQWEAFGTAFEKLPREEQSILGKEFLRLIQNKQQHTIGVFFSKTMRLAALKAWARAPDILRDLATSIFDGLTDPFKIEFGWFLQGLIDTDTLYFRQLPEQMQNVLLNILSSL